MAWALLGSPGAVRHLEADGQLDDVVAAAIPQPAGSNLSVGLLRRRARAIADALRLGGLAPSRAAVQLQALFIAWEVAVRGGPRPTALRILK